MPDNISISSAATLVTRVALAGALAAGITGTAWVTGSEHVASSPAYAATTTTSTGVADLNAEQIGNARTIIGVGKGAGISDQGIKIALITAMQESTLQNLSWGHSDSLGLFQQRPSMGWGTAAELQDPAQSSRLFYGVAFGANPGLAQIQGWESMAPAEAAQAVQRSAYPDAYAQWIGLSDEIMAQEAATVAPVL